MTLISQHIPRQTHADKRRALQTAAKHVLSKGVFCDWNLPAISTPMAL